jgi:hypothetical protein
MMEMDEAAIEKLRRDKAFWREERDSAQRALNHHANGEGRPEAQLRLDRAQGNFTKAVDALYAAMIPVG